MFNRTILSKKTDISSALLGFTSLAHKTTFVASKDVLKFVKEMGYDTTLD